ncbi:MAG: hypothetical protein NVSMB66_6580 [Candidatus Doudnabacteria bacterium]
MKFIIWSNFGELLDLAIHLKEVEKNEVLLYIPDKEYQKIGEGIIPKLKGNWFDYTGKGYIWCVDGCSDGRVQDYLREKGEAVFGGCKKGDKLENDRQLGQNWFKAAGFYQPESVNFKDIDKTIEFAKKRTDKMWVLKQNGDAPKSINHIQKFKSGVDMIFHLEELKKTWNDGANGKFDCDLMEKVEGMEVAASVFFNGKDFLKNKEGKVCGFINWEEKKETDGNGGDTTGEMGTSFLYADENNKMFREIIMKPKIKEVLQKIGFRGVFDINGSITKKGYVAFEPTMRFGVPATSYEFLEGLDMRTDRLIEIIAKGLNAPISLYKGLGMVMVIASRPYPVEADIEASATSQEQVLWDNKKESFFAYTPDTLKHVHLQNFYKEDDKYRVATKNGYLFTCTGRGKTIKETRESLIKYIEENTYISGMKIRRDIGKRVEDKLKL